MSILESCVFLIEASVSIEIPLLTRLNLVMFRKSYKIQDMGIAFSHIKRYAHTRQMWQTICCFTALRWNFRGDVSIKTLI